MVFVADRNDHYQRHDYLTRRNLLWQIEYLQDCINLGITAQYEGDLSFDAQFLYSLNHFATANLTETPGVIRNGPVYITRSIHKCPPPEDVARHVSEFVESVNKDWRDRDAFELSAFVLWRINWIHPFFEGNGRTARAAAYYVLCRKYEILLPGSNTIIKQLSGNNEYYSGLRHADTNVVDGRHDLGPLVRLLEECYEAQLASGGIRL